MPIYSFGPFRLDPAERRLLLGDEVVPLPPKVLDTLVALVEADGRLVERDALMRRLWPDTVVEEVNLARNVSLLRKALGDQDGRTYIETVPKSGYRFTAPITRVTGPVDPRRLPISRTLAGLLVIAAAVAATAVVWVLNQRGSAGPIASSNAGEPALPNHLRATFEGNVVESALSPDGTMVASLLMGPPMQLVLRDLTTGSTVETLRGMWIYRPKWSPDGFAVAVTWRPAVNESGGLVIVPRLGGPPSKLLPGGYGAWSPDGRRFARVGAVTRGFGIFDLDGVLVKDVRIGGFQWLIDLDWSRATDRLLLWTENEQRHTILWSASPDGAEVSQIYTSKTRLLGATWSSDGSAVYVLRPVAETAELVKVPLNRRTEADEQVLVRGLTAGKGISLSADGSKLLFLRVTPVANLWRVTVDDSVRGTPATTVQLTRGASGILSPVMSPDDRWIAFVRADGNDAVIQKSVLPLDGPTDTLTPAGLNVESPAWSPDGSHIAFATRTSGGSALWMVGLNDGSRRPLPTARPIERDTDSIAWAPDGRLAYQTSDRRHYYLLDPGTGQEQRLGTTDTGYMSSPRFSPDGALVAVYWNRAPSGPALWTIDLKTGAETFIAKGIKPIGWSPGNRAVYGVPSMGRGDPEIVRVDRSTGSETVVTRFPSGVVLSGSVSRDGRQIVCSVGEDIADAWIIEDFDPQPTKRPSAAR